MTPELKATFIENFGTGTGPTRYEQLREFARIANLPMNPPVGRQTKPTISRETILRLIELSELDWEELFIKYRVTTRGQAVRLSDDGLREVKEVLRGVRVQRIDSNEDREELPTQLRFL